MPEVPAPLRASPAPCAPPESHASRDAASDVNPETLMGLRAHEDYANTLTLETVMAARRQPVRPWARAGFPSGGTLLGSPRPVEVPMVRAAAEPVSTLAQQRRT